jgi:hypothetical protein
VHLLLSLQVVPLGAVVGGLQVPVASTQVPAVWQASAAGGQTTGAPAQVPLVQTSVVVQFLASLQVVPFGLFTPPTHKPEPVSQLPASWQAVGPLHWTGLLPAQVPAVQASVWVQALPSLHEVPFGAVGVVQVPVDSWQMPWVWQAAGAGQTMALPPQTPPVHRSAVVQRRLSSQGVPSGLAEPPTHRPEVGLQVPAVVQAPAPEHWTGAPGTQMPAWQLSAWVQAFPSLQVAPSGDAGWVHTPLTTTSRVQGLPSSGQTSTGQAVLGGVEAAEQWSRSQPSCWLAKPAGTSKL